MSAALDRVGVSFVVPALDEQENIRATVDEVLEAAKGLGSFEVILVDDGSTDDTGRIMDELAAGHPAIAVVHNRPNRGLGGAYKVGLARASQEYVMLVPGDNSFPADCLRQILAVVGQADVVVPYRLNPEARGLGRRIGSSGFTTVLNLLFGLRIRYYNGLVVHRTALVRSIDIETDGFAYQAEALIKLLRQGHSYVEVGTIIEERRQGASKALRPKNLLSVARTIIRLWRSVRRQKGPTN